MSDERKKSWQPRVHGKKNTQTRARYRPKVKLNVKIVFRFTGHGVAMP